MNESTCSKYEDSLPALPSKGWGMVLFAAALWGSTGIVFQIIGSTGSSNAQTISFLRLAMSAPIFLVLARWLLGRWMVPLNGKELMPVLALGATMAMYQLTYVLAIERVGVAISVLISICGAPIVLALISIAGKGSHLSARTVVSIVSSIVGVVLVIDGSFENSEYPIQFWVGIVISIACAAFQALYILSAQHCNSICHPLHAAGLGYSFGAIILLIIGGMTEMKFAYSSIDWMLLFYVAIIPTALAQTLFLTGVKGTGAIGGAIASMLEPLVACMLAVVILNEPMTIARAVGAVILIGGIAIVKNEEREDVQGVTTKRRIA
jgi:DME family drug/metabolite transporter